MSYPFACPSCDKWRVLRGSIMHQMLSSLFIKVGPLSGVEPELLRHAYPLAAIGTVAENAELIIESGDVIVSCTQCGAESVVKPNRLLCKACGDFRTRLISGDEMTLERVELTRKH